METEAEEHQKDTKCFEIHPIRSFLKISLKIVHCLCHIVICLTDSIYLFFIIIISEDIDAVRHLETSGPKNDSICVAQNQRSTSED